MNLSLKYKVFYKKYAIKSLVYFRNPKVFKVEDLELPIGSIIHWIPEVENDIGPTAVTPFLIRSEGIATVYHVETLIVTLGKAVKRIPNNSNLSKQYHKSNVKIHKVKQLAMGVSRNRLLLVLNYGFLNHQYKYSPNNMSLYNEWFNLRDTMWNNVAEIGSDRVHLVKYTLPKELPTKAQFQLYLNKMSVAGLKVFNTNEALNLLV